METQLVGIMTHQHNSQEKGVTGCVGRVNFCLWGFGGNLRKKEEATPRESKRHARVDLVS